MKRCEKCGREYQDNEFYRTNRIDKYLDGRLNICKQCINKELEETGNFKQILKEVDVPYIEKIWNNFQYKDNILGIYIAIMHLQSYKNYRWKDSEWFNQEQEKQKE